MCGIFGFYGKNMDVDLLNKLSIDSSRRGCHSCSFIVDNKLIRPKDYLILKIEKKHEFVMGHYRLNTGYEAGIDTQPIYDDGIYLAHNGFVPNYDKIKTNYSLKTNIDSEIILHDYVSSEYKKNIGENYSVVIKDFNFILLSSSGKIPLYVKENDNGIYYSSLEFKESVKLKGEKIWILKK